jgi:Na+/phosphate symporter
MNLKKYKHLFNIHLVASTSVAALFHFAFILAALFLWIEPPTIERDQPIFKELQVHFKDAPSQYLEQHEIDEILRIEEAWNNLPDEEKEYLSKLPKPSSVPLVPLVQEFSTDSEAFPQLK